MLKRTLIITFSLFFTSLLQTLAPSTHLNFHLIDRQLSQDEQEEMEALPSPENPLEIEEMMDMTEQSDIQDNSMEMTEQGGQQNLLMKVINKNFPSLEQQQEKLFLIAQTGEDLNLMPYLVDNIGINLLNPLGSSLLIVATVCNQIEVIKQILQYPDFKLINSINEYSALMIACYRGYQEIVQLLLNDDRINATMVRQGDGDSALLIALDRRQEAIAEMLIDELNSFSLDCSVNHQEVSALMSASRKGFTRIVQKLIKKMSSVGVHRRDRIDNNALMYASSAGRSDIVQILLDYGLDPNLQGSYNKTALHFALDPDVMERLYPLNQKNLTKTVEALVNSPSINLKGIEGRQALRLAIKESTLGSVQALVNHPDIQVSAGHLFNAIKSKKEDIAICLVHHMDDSTLNIFNETSFLIEAVYHKLPKLVQLLIERGLDINLQTDKGHTALIIAIQNKNPEIVKLLLAQDKIDLTLKLFNKFTPLDIAYHKRNDKIIELLLQAYQKHNILESQENLRDRLRWIARTGKDVDYISEIASQGIDLNIHTDSMDPPLITASSCGHTEVVKKLLSFPTVDPNIKCTQNETSIFWTVIHNQPEILSLLIEDKRTPVLSKSDIKHLISLAIDHKHTKIAQLLIQIGGFGSHDSIKNNGNSLLMLATVRGNEDLLQTLLTPSLLRGKSLETRNHDGNTALMEAVRCRNLQAVQILFRNGASLSAFNYDFKTPLDLAKQYRFSEIVAFLNSPSYNTFQMRSSLRKANEERRKKSDGQTSLLDEKNDDLSFSSNFNLRKRLIQFSQNHNITFNVKEVDRVYSRLSSEQDLEHEVLAENQTDILQRHIQVNITKSLQDIAYLAGLTDDDYQLLIDFILLNELLQGLEQINHGEQITELTTLKELECGSQIASLLTLSASMDQSSPFKGVQTLLHILKKVIKAGGDYLYTAPDQTPLPEVQLKEDAINPERQITSKSIRQELFQLEGLELLIEGLKKEGFKGHSQITWQEINNKIKKSQDLQTQLSDLAQQGWNILSAA